MNVLQSCLDQGKISLSGKGNVPTSPPRTRILVYQINLLQQPQVISYSLFQQKLPPKIMLHVYFNLRKVDFHDSLKKILLKYIMKKNLKKKKYKNANYLSPFGGKLKGLVFHDGSTQMTSTSPFLFRILLSYMYMSDYAIN